MAKARVLVVDDDPVLTTLIGGILAKTGTIHTANSGADGLQMARTLDPDLILLDVQMPGQDGFDVISDLKSDPALRHIPVIFITGEVIPEIESHCLESGAADYIAKPVTPRVLQARARTHLLLKQQADMLAELSFFDPLTDAVNRTPFQHLLAGECARATAGARPLSTLLVAIDQFDKYNETYGYAAGDRVLTAVVAAVAAAADRPGDVVARLAGNRIAVLLPETSFPEASATADRVVAAVRDLALRHNSSEVADIVTVSVGLIAAASGTTPDTLLGAVQSALQVARDAGGNRVNAAPGL